MVEARTATIVADGVVVTDTDPLPNFSYTWHAVSMTASVPCHTELFSSNRLRVLISVSGHLLMETYQERRSMGL